MARKPIKRDSRGRFARGHAGGLGRPPAPREERYLEILRQTVDLSQWQKAVEAVLTKAQSGDLRAFEALARYIMPLPAQRLKISEESTAEYRVAGWSPDQLDQAMMARLLAKIAERRQYESEIRKHQDDTSNGTGVPQIADHTKRAAQRSRRQS